jgi:hypothetical protein
VRFGVSIAIGAILILLGVTATAPATTTTTRSPTRITIMAPKLASTGENVRVDGRVIGGSSIVAPALFRVSTGITTIRRKMIKIHESRFRTWTYFSRPGVYGVSVFYPGDDGSVFGDSGHSPSSARVYIRVV